MNLKGGGGRGPPFPGVLVSWEALAKYIFRMSISKVSSYVSSIPIKLVSRGSLLTYLYIYLQE